jgi:uncharacterized protein (UPF0332 family)
MNRDIAGLLDKAERSLSAARLLLDQEHHDFAGSRCYYAMFYVAEALLVSLGESYSSHAAVIGAFGREFAKTGKLDPKFHRWLIDAQDIRNVGDYGVGKAITAEQVNEVIIRAQEFIVAGRDYLKGRRKTRDQYAN